MSKDLKFYYSKGKDDAIKGIYDPPHGIIDELTTWSKAELNHSTEENIAYTRGYFYAKGVEHCKLNIYEPPMSKEQRAAYDEGYYQSHKAKTIK